jgi:muconolactone delta-isomerase
MQYLVQLRISSSARPMTQEDGIAFIEQLIFPTLELCKKLQEEKKILAGGPTSGAVGLVLIVNAESARELDELITSLPVWPRMETEVTPLTTFDGRALTLRPRVEQFRTQVRSAAGGAAAAKGSVQA